MGDTDELVDMPALEAQRLQTLDGRQRTWLKGYLFLGIKDMRFLSSQEVADEFKKGRRDDIEVELEDAKIAGQVSLCYLIRTLVWQAYLLVLNKHEQPLHGNMRSLWYRLVEPFCIRHKLFEEDPSVQMASLLDYDLSAIENLYELDTLDFHLFGEGGGRGNYILNLMGKAIDQFVLHRVFTFREPFDFRDPRESFHMVGAKRPSLLFYTEKEGLWYLAQEFAHKYGISAMASKGEPGLLTLEYFSDQLAKRKVGNLHIAALTDYDPWGFIIATNIEKKLQFYYFETYLSRLTSVKLFPPNKIDYYKRDLTKVNRRKKAQVDEWMRITNGINGEPYSLHIDNADQELVRKAVDGWVKERSR